MTSLLDARHWIDGEWVDAEHWAESINPATGEIIGNYTEATEAQATQAIAATTATTATPVIAVAIGP